jgi:hypothetical protein
MMAFIRMAVVVMLLRGLMTINLSAKILAINVSCILQSFLKLVLKSGA